MRLPLPEAKHRKHRKHRWLEALVIGVIVLACLAGLRGLRAVALHFGGIPQPTLRLGVASSLRPLLDEFEFQGGADGERVEVIFGSSGRIAGQLSAGAGFDVVLLADAETMDRLAAAGLIDSDTRRDLAGNRLVLVARAGSVVPTGLDGLGPLRVALGEPSTVPLGRYAAEAIDAAGVAQPGSVVYGASAEQVLAYARSGEVDAAIVYATDLRRAGDGLRRVEEIDPASHRPIVYPAAVTSASTRPKAAAAWLDGLGSENARAAFRDAGFAPPAAAR